MRAATVAGLALALVLVRPADAQDGGRRPVEVADAVARSADAGLRDAGVRDAAAPADAAGAADAQPPDGGSTEPAAPSTGPSTTGPSGPNPERPAAGDGGQVIRTLLGLVALLALAWLGAHPRIQRLEERLGISQVVTSGLPFVGLGILARAPGVDVLTDEVLSAITPLLQFGLAWIGFHTGFQFEAARADEVPRGTSSAVILLTGGSFATIAVSSGAALFALGLGAEATTLARDAVAIGLAGALSAPTLGRLAPRVSTAALDLVRTVGQLDDVVGVVALAMLFAWLHPGHQGWELPGVGWLFITFGMATTLGLLVHVVLRGSHSSAESGALMLGSVCLTAGLAGFFSLPPLVVAFLAGILLRNLPGVQKDRLATTFARLERPIYLVFLVVVGALWRLDDWRGWVLAPIFVVARIVGRLGGARLARRLPDRHPGLDQIEDLDLAVPPMGALALALVVTARALYASPAMQAIVTAVLAGAIAIEILVQIVSRRSRAA